MKFLHISDLHIGKRLNEFSMIEDQRYVLRQILNIAETERADGVIIAGDIYDKTVPSAEAVQLFDWFLTGLVERGKKVFAVSGNHDSPERIAFGSRLMSGSGVYVSPVYEGRVSKVSLYDEYGEVCVYLLPFVKPATVRHALEKESAGEPQSERSGEQSEGLQRERPGELQEELQRETSGESRREAPDSYQSAVKLAVERMEVDTTKRNLLVAHQFVTGAGRCDSEEASVGGLDNVDAEAFDDFDYVALGHIHSPQWVGREMVRYCGTPLKYSFSEAEQEKSVTILDWKEKGELALHVAPLKPLRDMRKIRGTYQEVMSRDFYRGTDTEDYVQITLTDEEDIPDGLQKLRTVYPNLMRLVYDNNRTRQERNVESAGAVERKTELELFREFYELQNNRPMSGEQIEFVERRIEDIRQRMQ